MKILVMAMSFFGVGGIERYSRNLTLALCNLYGKENVDMLSIYDRARHKVNGECYGYINIAGHSLNLLTKLKFIWNCFILTLKNNYDVIVCCHVFLSPVAFFMQLIFGVKYITAAHNIEVARELSWFRRRGLKNSNLIISTSKFTKEILYKRHGIEQSKIRILNTYVPTNDIDNGLRYKKLELLRDKYDLDGYKTLLTVARFNSTERYKGYDTVIYALQKILPKIPNVKYLLVGDGDDIARVKRLSEDIGLNDNVVFAGLVSDEDILYYYNLCDVFVMPSKGEGFGIVFLEALSCGRPVIAGNRDGSRDALLDGKLGILVEPDNVEEVANAIIKVLEKKVEPYLLDERYLRDMVQEHFGFQAFSKKVKEIFDCLLCYKGKKYLG